MRGNTCMICGFVSSSQMPKTAKNHLITHLHAKVFKCNICWRAFTTPFKLKCHKSKVHLVSCTWEEARDNASEDKNLLYHNGRYYYKYYASPFSNLVRNPASSEGSQKKSGENSDKND